MGCPPSATFFIFEIFCRACAAALQGGYAPRSLRKTECPLRAGATKTDVEAIAIGRADATVGGAGVVIVAEPRTTPQDAQICGGQVLTPIRRNWRRGNWESARASPRFMSRSPCK